MALLQLVRVSTGQVSVKPGDVKMISTDNLATITAANYIKNNSTSPAYIIGLSPSDVIECLYSYNVSTGTGTLAYFQPTLSAGVFTLNLWENPGNVLLPVVDNDFANFNGTSGQIKDAGYSPTDATKTKVVMANGAVAINRFAKFSDVAGTVDDATSAGTNLGDIYAGADAVAGAFRSYPATTATGFLGLTGVSNSGAFNTIISNAAMGQTSTISIPDPGAATALFVLSAVSGGSQSIGGSLTVAGAISSTAGDITSGSSGNAGSFISFPATAANGTLIVAAVNAGGAFNTTISNAASVGQSQVVSVPDVGAATGNFLAAGAALVNGEFAVLSGTGGRVVSSGVAASALQLSANIKAATTADIGGAGAGPISVVVAGLTAASPIVATIASSSNVVSVAKCIGTATGFDITFSGDPGAACVVNYVAFIAAQ